ncbi:(2Fe-2S)-binding protein [Streptomyces macrosporus]|uniref:Bacterioferritin-associated ferredoxin n=1 Tax=Streptomyces macrosporus TaxID=44032 RepID=A0ABP5X6K3_9ACTN
MYVCSCFGVTEEQIREHAAAGACTPRQIASASKAGTDCGSCVRRIQGLLGRGTCPRREAANRLAAGAPAAPETVPAAPAAPAVPSVPAAPAAAASSAEPARTVAAA